MVSLVVPASSEKMLGKARTLDADEIVFDLEDAVIPARKAQARELLLAALSDDAPFKARRIAVRINAVGGPWAHEELIALAAAPRLDTIVVPKVESAADLHFVDRLLTGAEAAAEAAAAAAGAGAEATPTLPGPKQLHALIETAAGLTALDEIAIATPRLGALIIGYADLSVSLGRTPAGRDDLDRWLAVQERVLLAARTHGLEAIDGPHLVIDDSAGLQRAATRVAELGFDRKWAIHPSHIDPIRAAFAPSEEELENARQILDALADAAQQGGGAVAHNGQMLDEPVRLAAIRTLQRAGIDTP